MSLNFARCVCGGGENGQRRDQAIHDNGEFDVKSLKISFGKPVHAVVDVVM